MHMATLYMLFFTHFWDKCENEKTLIYNWLTLDQSDYQNRSPLYNGAVMYYTNS